MSDEGMSDALGIYLTAAESELEVCPHCETWLLADCVNGRGCPTPDGRNGETIRAALTANRSAPVVEE